ncbi:unnamed protein product [Blepharisma stoltei]|uniref:P-type phospholipid transporter n=1 Tax=Blepharisma stoltei TaxID=1481888 RepID=A0AAU9JD17_9CILI|nr:unnamed protein product [Blepharisma stoltei]
MTSPLSENYTYKPGTTTFKKDTSKAHMREIEIYRGQGYKNNVFPDNKISTNKYTYLTLFQMNLFEQFQRLGNIWYLIITLFQYIPYDLSPYVSLSTTAIFVIVLILTLVHDALADFLKRRSDSHVNTKDILVWSEERGEFFREKWMQVRVGHIIIVKNEEEIPADLLLLATSDPENICFLETSNLDGETRLSRKKAMPDTAAIFDSKSYEKAIEQLYRLDSAVIKIDHPNYSLYSVEGSFKLVSYPRALPLTHENIVYRGTQLKNTNWIMGVVVYTGTDTKIIMNTQKIPSKRSQLEKQMNKYLALMLSIVGVMVLLCYILSLINSSINRDAYKVFTGHSWSYSAYDILSFAILFSYMVPITLYVVIDIVSTVQSVFIAWDLRFYDNDKKKNIETKNLHLNEDLGKVQYIFADKTGTLTENKMSFKYCIIHGKTYNQDQLKEKVKDESSHHVLEFLEVLALCHTVIPEKTQTGMEYKGVSRDEEALVKAACHAGVEYRNVRRNLFEIKINGSKCLYKICGVNEFDPDRKRMSIVVRPLNDYQPPVLLCKGSDSVLFQRSNNSSKYITKLTGMVENHAKNGLRTLIIAKKVLTLEEADQYEEQWLSAKNAMSNRQARLRDVAENWENNLTILGSVAIEDKIQEGAPEAIDTLKRAGIKIWMLTGDKRETAVNAAYACSLFNSDLEIVKINYTYKRQVYKTLKTEYYRHAFPEDSDHENSPLAKGIHDNIWESPGKNGRVDTKNSGSFNTSRIHDYGFVIDGQSLEAIFENVKYLEFFITLAYLAKSVVICRAAPLQKAEILKIFKKHINKPTITLAIGDGSNDVSMIHEANVGIGILGNEGFQAANSSDFAIANFKDLVPLLLIHGHWNYIRIAKVIQCIFYNNFLLEFVLFLFTFQNMYSASLLYDSWLVTIFHVFFTAVPVILMGIFDRDKKAEVLLRTPELYNKNQFKFRDILAHILMAAYQALLIFLFVNVFARNGALSSDGYTEDFFSTGVVVYLIVFQVTMHEIFIVAHTWNLVFLIANILMSLFALSFVFIYDYGRTATYYMHGTSTKVYSTPIYLFLLFVTPYVCLAFRLPFYYANKLFLATLTGSLRTLRHTKSNLSTELSNDFSKTFSFKNFQYSPDLKPMVFNYQMNHLTLKFDNPYLENEFEADITNDKKKLWRKLSLATSLIAIVAFIVAESLDSEKEHISTGIELAILFLIHITVFFVLMTKTVFRIYKKAMIYWIAASLVLQIVINFRFSYEFSLTSPLISFASFLVLRTNTYLVLLLNLADQIGYSIWIFIRYTTDYNETEGVLIGFLYLILTLGIVMISGSIGYILEKGKKLQYLYLELVEFQFNKGLEILSNLFPHFIKSKVKNGERAIALQQPEVTVMFCDIYGFDNICATHAPSELIELLDTYFALLDNLCEDHGVAKIETVNKTYMACAGMAEDEKLLPKSKLAKNHGKRTLELALDILKRLEHVYLKTGEKLRVKIGINSGPVIAGVVGLYKPQFSLVGDTVNTSSRMCSTLKEPDSIQISMSTYNLVSEEPYLFEPNQVEAKGKGLLDTFIVKTMEEPKLIREYQDPFSEEESPGIPEAPQETGPSRFTSNKTDDFINTRLNRFYTVYQGREKGAVIKKGENVLNDLINRTGQTKEELGLVDDLMLWVCHYNTEEEEAEFRIKEMNKFKAVIKFEIWGGIILIFLATIVHLLAFILTEIYMSIEVIAIKLFVILLLIVAILRFKKIYRKVLFSWTVMMGFIVLGGLNVISIYQAPAALYNTIALEILFELQLIGHTCYLPFGNLLVSTIILIVPSVILFGVGLPDDQIARTIVPYIIFSIINIWVSFYKEKQSRTTFNLRKLMKREISKTDTLLKQLIPPHAVRNMMEDQATTDRFSNVTIIFADICGFTAFSSTRSPEQVVSMLSGFFEIFDKLCLEHNVYKVHTIGDCYVVISFRDADKRKTIRNLSEECENMVNMAFDMVKAIKRVDEEKGLELNMRIGIHTGDLLAGITGTNIVRYDIYGPDVDIANKMESNGVPGKVDISEETKRILEDGFPGKYNFEFNKKVTHKPINRILDAFFISRAENQDADSIN